jgi:hypothetical protein
MATDYTNSDIPASMEKSYSMELNQALLKEDDDLLRQIFSRVFRHHHPEVANKVDVIFSLAQVCINFNGEYPTCVNFHRPFWVCLVGMVTE